MIELKNQNNGNRHCKRIEAVGIGNGKQAHKIRTKKSIDRAMESPSKTARFLWMAAVLGLMNVVILGAGFSRYMVLRYSRQRYRTGRARKGGV